jgi:hypothetical protein
MKRSLSLGPTIQSRPDFCPACDGRRLMADPDSLLRNRVLTAICNGASEGPASVVSPPL